MLQVIIILGRSLPRSKEKAIGGDSLLFLEMGSSWNKSNVSRNLIEAPLEGEFPPAICRLSVRLAIGPT